MPLHDEQLPSWVSWQPRAFADANLLLAIGVLAFSSELDDSNIAAVGQMLHMAAARITARTGGISPSDAVEVAGTAAPTVT